MEWAEQWFGFGFKAAERRTDRERERERRCHGGMVVERESGTRSSFPLPRAVWVQWAPPLVFSASLALATLPFHVYGDTVYLVAPVACGCVAQVVVLTSQRWKKPPPPGIIACVPLQRARRVGDVRHYARRGGCEESRKPEGCFCDFYPQAQGQAVRVGASRRRRAPSSPIRLHVAHTTDRLVRGVSVRYLFFFFVRKRVIIINCCLRAGRICVDGIRFGRMLGVGWRRSEATPALLCSAPLPPSVGGTVVAATGDQQRSDFAKPSVVVSVARRRWRRVNAAQRSDGHGALAGAWRRRSRWRRDHDQLRCVR